MCDFEADEAVLAGLLEDFVEHLQQFRVALGAERIRLEQCQQLCERGLDDGRRVSGDHGAESGTADDQELVGLDEHGQLAMVHDVAADHAAEHDDQSDDDNHAVVPGLGCADGRAGSAMSRSRDGAAEAVTSSLPSMIPGMEMRQAVARARWLEVQDELLRGVTHALSNRIATVSAAAYMLEYGDVTQAEAAESLRTETERMDALLQLLRAAALARRRDVRTGRTSPTRWPRRWRCTRTIPTCATWWWTCRWRRTCCPCGWSRTRSCRRCCWRSRRPSARRFRTACRWWRG